MMCIVQKIQYFLDHCYLYPLWAQRRPLAGSLVWAIFRPWLESESVSVRDAALKLRFGSTNLNGTVLKMTYTSWSCSCPSWLISRRLKISSGLRLSSLASSSWPSCTISWLSIRPFSWASWTTSRHSCSDKNSGISAEQDKVIHCMKGCLCCITLGVPIVVV